MPAGGGGVAIGDNPIWTGNHVWNNVLLGPLGAAGAPAYSFNGDQDAGMYQQTVNRLDFSVAGVQKISIRTNVIFIADKLNVDDGTAANPGYAFDGDSNTGMFNAANDTIGFTTAGSEKMRIDPSGNVGINETSPNAKLEVKAALADLFTVQISSQDGSTVWNIDRLGLEQPASFTIAELKLISPRALGQYAYCSDCTLAGGRRVESTGTAAGEWADADGSNWE